MAEEAEYLGCGPKWIPKWIIFILSFAIVGVSLTALLHTDYGWLEVTDNGAIVEYGWHRRKINYGPWGDMECTDGQQYPCYWAGVFAAVLISVGALAALAQTAYTALKRRSPNIPNLYLSVVMASTYVVGFLLYWLVLTNVRASGLSMTDYTIKLQLWFIISSAVVSVIFLTVAMLPVLFPGNGYVNTPSTEL